MNHIYAVQSQEELQTYQDFAANVFPRLDAFLAHLQKEYQVTSLPRCVVLTDRKTATQLISDIPVPAYTNDYRTVFCPDLSSWKEIYLHQLEDAENGDVRRYYETALTENHLLQILGHEFVHHSDLFLEEAYARGIWFEEGMCEYISRRFFLTDQEFKDETHINALLVELFMEKHGEHSLEDFGAATYKGGFAGIFFEYWRSFLAVKQIVEHFDGNLPAVFDAYHTWYRSGRTKTLSQWFGLEI